MGRGLGVHKYDFFFGLLEWGFLSSFLGVIVLFFCCSLSVGCFIFRAFSVLRFRKIVRVDVWWGCRIEKTVFFFVHLLE